jgi:hypothetical protein
VQLPLQQKQQAQALLPVLLQQAALHPCYLHLPQLHSLQVLALRYPLQAQGYPRSCAGLWQLLVLLLLLLV